MAAGLWQCQSRADNRSLFALLFRAPDVLNISRGNMSQLLVSEGGLGEERPLWLVPTLGGPPRRLGNIAAHDGSWSPKIGQKFVYANGKVLCT